MDNFKEKFLKIEKLSHLYDEIIHQAELLFDYPEDEFHEIALSIIIADKFLIRTTSLLISPQSVLIDLND